MVAKGCTISQVCYLLSDTDSQALRSLNNFLEECSDCLNGDKLHALIREHESVIPEEAYGALATIAYKPKNRGWMSEMEIANRGSEYNCQPGLRICVGQEEKC